MTTEQSNQLQALYDKLINIDDGKRTVIYLGNSNSYNLNNYEGYQDFTIDNFLIEVISTSTSGYANDNVGSFSVPCNVTKTYDSSTGDLSISGVSNVWRKAVSGGYASTVNASISYKVYLIY